jgi:hypothetical protein
LPQATVNVLGTALGGYTTESGHFTIPAPDGTVTLRIRRIGYREKTVTVPAGGGDVYREAREGRPSAREAGHHRNGNLGGESELGQCSRRRDRDQLNSRARYDHL